MIVFGAHPLELVQKSLRLFKLKQPCYNNRAVAGEIKMVGQSEPLTNV